MSLRFDNPAGVHPPLGLYTHTVTVPEGAQLLYLSGQLGVRADGFTQGTKLPS